MGYVQILGVLFALALWYVRRAVKRKNESEEHQDSRVNDVDDFDPEDYENLVDESQ